MTIALRNTNLQTSLRSMLNPKNHPEAKNPAVVKEERNKILEYSNKKRMQKRPPPYSTLYPETSSDSPSTKSKGARLHSAIVEINHIKKTGNKMTAGQHHIRVSEWLLKLKEPLRNPDVINNTKNLAS